MLWLCRLIKEINMNMKLKFYIEWWVLGDSERAIQANTFHCTKKSICHFIKSFKDSGKNIVHLSIIEPVRKALIGKQKPQHVS